ncbi:amidohydrolase [Ktedonosporobacter rubrisoli]|uniref:Amidohydrolase n=1 Tax=Ktedonosporobacter rubrisoli TaxID=2509675 RepID=A0A4P6JJK0_KTERU|nr:amidohydrolase family protein [Ktedonosporobacter rubrisoli]QBD75288.1 amidohydrolase [Ktedonosporobacter rubrisoli]
MVTTPITAASPTGSSYTGPIIDTDVHETISSWKHLAPYLGEPWRGLLERGAWTKPGAPFAYWASHGVNRADSFPDSGAPAGSNYELFKAQVLDLYPIKYAILTGQFMPGIMEMQFEFASALASAYNDWLFEHWLQKDERILTSIHVAPQDPQAAVREIERLGDHPRVVQIILPIAQLAYGDPFYHPIFEAAQRHNLVIGLHHSSFVKGAMGRGRYYIEWHVNVPQGAMSLLTSLVCNGVFDKYPNLKFNIIESGWSWLPHLLWRFDQNYRSLQQEIPWVKRLPSEHILERVKFSTQPTEDFDAQTWLRLIELLGTDRLFVFATDYPHWDFDAPNEAIPRGLPAALKSRIFYENARELYGLEQARSV